MEKTYHHLTSEERSLIQVSLELGHTPAEIARILDRPRSCISQELKRNQWVRSSLQVKKRGRPAKAGGYRAVAAQQRADKLSCKARSPKRLMVGSPLWDKVLILLKDRHSPEQVSGILKRMKPNYSTSLL